MGRIVSPHARSLRQTMPEAETRLWHRLRDRRLMGHKFRWQHSVGPYSADFACVAARLVVELDCAGRRLLSSFSRNPCELLWLFGGRLPVC